MMKKKNKFDVDFIKKAARSLKGETLDKLEQYKLHRRIVRKYSRLEVNVNKKNKR